MGSLDVTVKEKKRKKLFAGLVFGAIMSGLFLMTPIHAANECVVPSFLKVGNSYGFSFGMGTGSAKILGIDKQGCWIVVFDGRKKMAYNLNQLAIIVPN